MVTSKTTSTLLNDPALDELRQRENHELIAGIARRICRGERQTRRRRHSQTYIRLLPFPVFVDGTTCTCVAMKHYVLSHPRAREVEVLWYPSLAAAKGAHPKARVMPDVDRVQPRLQAAPAAEFRA